MPAAAKCTRRPVSVVGAATVSQSLGKGNRQSLVSRKSQGHVQSVLQVAPAPQDDPGGSHCSPASMTVLPQGGRVVDVVVGGTTAGHEDGATDQRATNC